MAIMLRREVKSSIPVLHLTLYNFGKKLTQIPFRPQIPSHNPFLAIASQRRGAHLLQQDVEPSFLSALCEFISALHAKQ
jgi:hypothetical protein